MKWYTGLWPTKQNAILKKVVKNRGSCGIHSPWLWTTAVEMPNTGEGKKKLYIRVGRVGFLMR